MHADLPHELITDALVDPHSNWFVSLKYASAYLRKAFAHASPAS